MVRFAAVLVCLFPLLSGCSPGMPRNAIVSEQDALNSLGDKMKGVIWDDDGHVYELDLHQTALSSHECGLLADLPGLTTLDLSSCHLDAECFDTLAALPNLRSLSLAWVDLEDGHLHGLSQCKNLRYLVLDHSNIEDDDLNHLASLKRLKHLWVQNTDVSEERAEWLRSRLPDCIVQR